MVAFLVPLAFLALGATAVFLFWGGTIVGDHVWPWESANADDDDPFEIPEIPLPESAKAALGAILLVGVLIFGATLLKGRGK